LFRLALFRRVLFRLVLFRLVLFRRVLVLVLIVRLCLMALTPGCHRLGSHPSLTTANIHTSLRTGGRRMEGAEEKQTPPAAASFAGTAGTGGSSARPWGYDAGLMGLIADAVRPPPRPKTSSGTATPRTPRTPSSHPTTPGRSDRRAESGRRPPKKRRGKGWESVSGEAGEGGAGTASSSVGATSARHVPRVEAPRLTSFGLTITGCRPQCSHHNVHSSSFRFHDDTLATRKV
jgi:hypothetical protein